MAKSVFGTVEFVLKFQIRTKIGSEYSNEFYEYLLNLKLKLLCHFKTYSKLCKLFVLKKIKIIERFRTQIEFNHFFQQDF